MDIRIPNLGEGSDSGSVVSIFVKEGDTVAKDQTLIELENEKAVAPIPSTQAGVVTKIYVTVGQKVSVGTPIVALNESGTQPGKSAGLAGNSPAAAVSSTPAAAAQPGQAPMPARSAEPGASAQAQASDGDYRYSSPSGMPPPASPTIRKIAQDLGIDLTRVRGTESGGRISMGDLKAYIQHLQSRAGAGPAAAAPASAKPAPPREKIDFAKWGPVQRKPVSSLRQKIGQKMTESWTTIPHVTQFDEADITALMALRKKHAPAYDKKGATLTLTPLIMKACVAALKKLPAFNSSLDEDAHELVLKEYYHLGVAVDTEQGLIVPVLRDADKKNVLAIAKELGELAERTRQRKVSIDDLKGGTFTISNLGSIGGTHFTPIVNAPEAAILGVGRGVLKPVVVRSGDKSAVEPRTMLPLCLSYDHRIVDGADGARFIREVVTQLENFKEEEVKI
ncbi:MAG TPA: 2-oxo acid dehydrogenase subunit E2 [Candidatus Eisenbacteria bacterium]|nr:2-oxo acid dehydrogenase subunit E2 [Candidatus Eisenbacteria bacterium]